MKRKRQEIFRAIEHERFYQDRKWGPLEKQNEQEPLNWIATLFEELREADQAIGKDEFFLELVQVAAVAIAALEQMSPDELDEMVRKHRGIGVLQPVYGMPMPPGGREGGDHMKTIWKFPLVRPKVNRIAMPKGARILKTSGETGENSPNIWALVDSDAEKEDRFFLVTGTGHGIPDIEGASEKYVGTFFTAVDDSHPMAPLLPRVLVYHVFELPDIGVAKQVAEALGDKWTNGEPECGMCGDAGRISGDIPCPKCGS